VLTYEGRVPGLYQAVFNIKQWQPEMIRTLSFPAGRTDKTFRWEEFAREVCTPTGAALVQKLTGGPAPANTCIYLFNGSGATVLQESGGMIDRDVLRQLCVNLPIGFFSLVSRVSPNGGAQIEDLQVMDQTDANQYLLVVVTRQGRDFLVRRCLVRDTD